MNTPQDLDNRFDYHAPDDTARASHQSIRDACKDTAMVFTSLLPDSREASLALTHLEQAMFWANAAVARHDDGGQRR